RAVAVREALGVALAVHPVAVGAKAYRRAVLVAAASGAERVRLRADGGALGAREVVGARGDAPVLRLVAGAAGVAVFVDLALHAALERRIAAGRAGRTLVVADAAHAAPGDRVAVEVLRRAGGVVDAGDRGRVGSADHGVGRSGDDGVERDGAVRAAGVTEGPLFRSTALRGERGGDEIGRASCRERV